MIWPSFPLRARLTAKRKLPRLRRWVPHWKILPDRRIVSATARDSLMATLMGFSQ